MDKTRRGEIARNILAVVGVTGIVIGGALCPGLLRLLRPYVHKRYSYQACRYAIKAMDAKGWMAVEKRVDGVHLYLTKRGQMELRAYELGEKKLKRSGKWDGKWHILIFDIAEKRRRARDVVRNTLKTLGFHRLQQSVWVYPYDCREVLNLLQVKHRVSREALYLRADHLDNDRWLRRHFGLKIE